MTMKLTITNAGITALINAENTGTLPLSITHIALGRSSYTPNKSQTTLVSEFKRITSFGGGPVASDTLHVTIQDNSSDTYSLGEFGLITSAGVLFAVCSLENGPILEKNTQGILLLSADTKFTDIDISHIEFGGTNFMLPPGTETEAGLLRLANTADAIAGENTTRAMSAKTTWQAIEQWFSLSGITAAINSKLASNHASVTNAREWTAATIAQAEAEAGTATARRAWTAQRVRQAILGWWNSSPEKTKLDGIAAGAQVNVPTNLTIGGTGNNRTLTSSTGNSATLSVANASNAGLMATGDKTKLDGVAAGATANATDAQLRARSSHTGTQAISTVAGLQDALDAKLNTDHPSISDAREWTAPTVSQADAEAGTSEVRRAWTAQRVRQAILSWWNGTADKTKLDSIAAGAQVNVPTNLSLGTRTATAIPLNSSTGTGTTLPAATSALAGLLSGTDKAKIDGIAPSATANATDAQLRARSSHTGTQSISTVAGLQDALDAKLNADHPSINDAREWTAPTVSQADAEAGTSEVRRAWTAQRVRQAILSWWNGTADKTKLDSIAAGAQVNVPTNLAMGGTGNNRTLTSSTGNNATLAVATASNAGLMATGDKTKLDGIAAGATANATDAQLRARSSHTGTQAISTVDGLQAELNNKLASNHASVTNAREWTADTIAQAEAEAGTATTRRAFTAQRARQAILGWWNGSAEKTKLDGIAVGATANATDAQLRARGSHTGTQAISTVDGLQAALNAKQNTLTASGVIAGSYGTGRVVPKLTIDSLGRVTAAAVESIPLGTATDPGMVSLSAATNSGATSGIAAAPAAVKAVMDYAAGVNGTAQAANSKAESALTLGSNAMNNADSRLPANHASVTNAREWTAATISKEEAEEGIVTTRRAFTAFRVRQAILGWWNSSAEKTKLDGIAAGAQVNVGTNLAMGGSGNSRTLTSSTGNNASLAVATSSNAGLMATGDKSKLDGIAAGATANATDAQLRARSSHTGTQAISTVAGLQDALNAKSNIGKNNYTIASGNASVMADDIVRFSSSSGIHVVNVTGIENGGTCVILNHTTGSAVVQLSISSSFTFQKMQNGVEVAGTQLNLPKGKTEVLRWGGAIFVGTHSLIN